MVTLDQLAALDLLLWQGSGERAAQLGGTNQSTISRRCRATLQVFGLSLQRGSVGWSIRGECELLHLERRVHQRARFLGRLPLRLQVPFWTRSTVLRHIPDGICANTFSSGVVCENPVRLLRERVIDAALVPSCQLPEASDDLLLVPLYGRPIELTVLNYGGIANPRDAFLRGCEEGELELQAMTFLPQSCQRNAARLFSLLNAGEPVHRSKRTTLAGGLESGIGIAFLTPEMRSAQPLPFQLEPGFEPYPYKEWLMVLAENAREAALQRLQEQLRELVVQLTI